jgi:hypothetical protein
MLTSTQRATIIGIVQELKGLRRKTIRKRRQNKGYFRRTGKRPYLHPSLSLAQTIAYETIQLNALHRTTGFNELWTSLRLLSAPECVTYESNGCDRFWTKSRSKRDADIQRGKHEHETYRERVKRCRNRGRAALTDV